MKMKPIEIKPNSGTELSGIWVVRETWTPCFRVKILFVGTTHFFAEDTAGDELCQKFNGQWFIYEKETDL